MSRFKHHILVCNSFRTKGEPQGICNKKGAPDLMQYLQSEVADRGLDCAISLTGCFNICEKGPAMVIYPEGWWYGKITEGKLDDILDALEEGQPAEEHLLRLQD